MTEISQSLARDHIEQALKPLPPQSSIFKTLAKFDFVPEVHWAVLNNIRNQDGARLDLIIDSISETVDKRGPMEVQDFEDLFDLPVTALTSIWLDRDIDFSKSLTAQSQLVRTLDLFQTDAAHGSSEIDVSIEQAQAFVGEIDEQRSAAIAKADQLIEQLEARLSDAAGLKVLELLEAESAKSNIASQRWMWSSIGAAMSAIAGTILLTAWADLDSWSDDVSRTAIGVSVGAFAAWFAVRSAQNRTDSRMQRELIIQARIAGITAAEEDIHDIAAVNEFFRKQLATNDGLVVLSPGQDRGLRATIGKPKPV